MEINLYASIYTELSYSYLPKEWAFYEKLLVFYMEINHLMETTFYKPLCIIS